MKHVVCITLCLCLALVCHAEEQSPPPDTAADEPKESLHVYLLIGQSNMAGRATIAKKDKGVIENCLLLNDEDEWEAARNPLNRYSSVRKDLGMQKLGPGYGFTQTMIKQRRGVTIGLVVNARGGTSIEQWMKGTKNYSEAIRRVTEARKAGTLKGVLWHQGEANRDKSDGYLEKLTTLINDLRKDLGEPDLPFIAGQVKDVPVINRQIAELPGKVVSTAVAGSEGLTTFDRFHFDAKSTRLLGQRYAQAMLEIQRKQGDASDQRAQEVE